MIDGWQGRQCGPGYDRTPHLTALMTAVDRLVDRLDGVKVLPEDVCERLHQQAALATLRLDGSPIERVPETGPGTGTAVSPAPSDAGPGEPATPSSTSSDDRRQSGTTGTWLDALGSPTDDRNNDERLLAAEYRGARAGLAADDLAERLHREPLDALARLHSRMTAGLVTGEEAGRPRTSRQAVHDASIGRVVYFAEEPANIPSRLARLEDWLDASSGDHGLVVSGVVHHELLAVHPYEAANGRLARTAARLLLRTHGLDPGGLAVAECLLVDDALGYYEEVAATARRGDLTIWLERWGEAVAGGLRLAASRLDLLDVGVPRRAAAFLDTRDQAEFTVADYAAATGTGPEARRGDLIALLDAGHVTRVPGSRGLRFTIV